MAASSHEEIVEAFDTFHSVVSRLGELSFDVLTTPERLATLERLEEETRRLPVPCHELINQIRRQAGPLELGGKLAHVLADGLRIRGRKPTGASTRPRIWGSARRFPVRRCRRGCPPPPPPSARARAAPGLSR